MATGEWRYLRNVDRLNRRKEALGRSRDPISRGELVPVLEEYSAPGFYLYYPQRATNNNLESEASDACAAGPSGLNVLPASSSLKLTWKA